MIQAVRYFFLHLSLALLLAHSLVPHQHGVENETPSFQSTAVANPLNVFDWLASLFQQDLGEDHLQNYRPSPEFLAVYLLPGLDATKQEEYDNCQVLLRSLSYIPYQTLFHDHHWSLSAVSRGPPSQI
ncbi:MAG: hypothetical protein AAF223_00360 [Bacteroidota bacterium]